MAGGLSSNNRFLSRLFRQDPLLVGEAVPDGWSAELAALEFAGAAIDQYGGGYEEADRWVSAVLASDHLTIGKLRKAIAGLAVLSAEAEDLDDEDYGEVVEFCRAILLAQLATAAFRWSIR
jgi:hypothetical protein